MARYLKSPALGLLVGLVMAKMALSAPTNNNSSLTTHPTLNTKPLNSGVESRGMIDEFYRNRAERPDKWAQFCDDDNCSENCGKSVSMGDIGCLEQPPTRRSIKVHGNLLGLDAVTLIVSPAGNCRCQAACGPVESTGPRVDPQSPAMPTSFWTPPWFQRMNYCWTISKFDWYDQHKEWSFHFRQEQDEPMCESYHMCTWNSTPIANGTGTWQPNGTTWTDESGNSTESALSRRFLW